MAVGPEGDDEVKQPTLPPFSFSFFLEEGANFSGKVVERGLPREKRRFTPIARFFALGRAKMGRPPSLNRSAQHTSYLTRSVMCALVSPP